MFEQLTNESWWVIDHVLIGHVYLSLNLVNSISLDQISSVQISIFFFHKQLTSDQFRLVWVFSNNRPVVLLYI